APARRAAAGCRSSTASSPATRSWSSAPSSSTTRSSSTTEMIEGLVKGSLQTRLLVFILAVFTAAAGWYAYSNLTIEAFPDPTDTQVQVITIYNGQPSEEVERRVSIPLERAL